jgi:hypothetical protein
MALLAAAAQPEVELLARPQSMGTYSRLEGMMPPLVEPQL